MYNFTFVTELFKGMSKSIENMKKAANFQLEEALDSFTHFLNYLAKTAPSSLDSNIKESILNICKKGAL